MPCAPSPAVLLVDDERAYADVLAETITDLLHVPVHRFNQPRMALEALPNLSVDLIVSDYFMPALNGYAFLERALQLRPGTPCILITGHNDAFEDARLSRLVELREILAKPFSPRLLVEAIRRHGPTIARAAATAGRPASRPPY